MITLQLLIPQSQMLYLVYFPLNLVCVYMCVCTCFFSQSYQAVYTIFFPPSLNFTLELWILELQICRTWSYL